MITGVTQGSALDPLPFTIFLNDVTLFISKYHSCNYVGEKTLFKSGKNQKRYRNRLHDFKKWFHENHKFIQMP